MSENYLIIKSIRKESSLTRLAVRVKKDVCLNNDAEHFMIYHSQSVSRLVEKLLSNDFTAERLSDPYYPIYRY